MIDLENIFRKIVDALNNLGNALKNVFEKIICLFKRPSMDFDKGITDYYWTEEFMRRLTNYYCSKCNGKLFIESHEDNYIIYRCSMCGKIHKAYKNKLLGRF